MKKSRGFTVIELVAAMGITAVFGAMILAISISSGKLFGMVQGESTFNDEARIIMSSMEDDIRVALDVTESAGSLSAQTSVTIDGNSYEVSPAAEVVAVVTKKGAKDASGRDTKDIYVYTRTQVDKEVVRRKAVGGRLIEPSIGLTNVSKLTLTKEGIDGYKISVNFDDSKGNTKEYESIVTSRN